jgi:hypothetical protein
MNEIREVALSHLKDVVKGSLLVTNMPLEKVIGVLAAWAKAHPPLPVVRGECAIFRVEEGRRCGKPAPFPFNNSPHDADFTRCIEHQEEHMAWLKKMGFE